MQSNVAIELVNYKIEITALRMKCRISRKRHRVSQGGTLQQRPFTNAN